MGGRGRIQQNPIEDMRDPNMPLRNVHFEIINGPIDKAESEAQKLDVETALAMVMAVQWRTSGLSAPRKPRR